METSPELMARPAWNVWLPHHAGYVGLPEEMVDEVDASPAQPRRTRNKAWAGGSRDHRYYESGTEQYSRQCVRVSRRSDIYKARNYLQRAGTDKPLSIYNNYGGTLGGPIVKNKLFWFFSYDANHARK